MKYSMNRAVFLDRDGVLNRKPPEGQYVTRWEDLEFLPGVDHAIALLKRAGFRVIVVSNQRCVAKGLLSLRDLGLIHKQMLAALAAANATIDEVYFCPHEKYPPCNCRKPRPGMLLSAAQDHGIDLVSSWMVGDSDIDVQAGKNAGCKTARIVNSGEPTNGNADLFAGSLYEAVQKLLAAEGWPNPA
jgi:D-glycero-D-manno-heptose 1,7-bisphosphate phosphatase